ncbi:hypothetical protein MTO96_007300 [Rhipicephalus appendiculatus]
MARRRERNVEEADKGETRRDETDGSVPPQRRQDARSTRSSAQAAHAEKDDRSRLASCTVRARVMAALRHRNTVSTARKLNRAGINNARVFPLDLGTPGREMMSGATRCRRTPPTRALHRQPACIV